VKKANFQGVMLICDKTLSSSLENGYVLHQIMEELTTFALLINTLRAGLHDIRTWISA